MTSIHRAAHAHAQRQPGVVPCSTCDAFGRERAMLIDAIERLSERVAAAEAEGADLVKLHVAHCRLHESRTAADVMTAVEEILVTVVGCERYAIFDAAGGDLTPVASMGMDPRELRPVPLGVDTLAQVAHTGDPLFPEPGADHARLAEADIPVACVPIRERDGQVIGLIALHELLPHKATFEATDRALMNLLSIEAARALATGSQARPA